MDEKRVCITGASRGIGLALTERYLDEGYVVIAVSRSAGRIQPNVDTSSLVRVEADVNTEEGRATIARAISDRGKLHTLIHNAGTLVQKPFERTEARELREVYEVNVFAPYLLTQRLMPLMEACHVISISSIGGVEDTLKFGGLSAYSSSKAALNCLTQMWAEEFKDSGHVFNCLALGSVQTEMFEQAFPGIGASCTPEEMAIFIQTFDVSARKMMNGKIISVSRSNP